MPKGWHHPDVISDRIWQHAIIKVDYPVNRLIAEAREFKVLQSFVGYHPGPVLDKKGFGDT